MPTFLEKIKARKFASAASSAVEIGVNAETESRLVLEAGGKLLWGSGAVVGDTNLYRVSADILKTDDTFKAQGLYVNGVEIDPTSASVSQVLKFNGTKFVPGVASTVGSIDDLSDVAIAGASVGQFLKWDGSQWVNATIIGGATVSANAPASPQSGQIWFDEDTAKTFVYYDSSWIEIGAGSGITSVTVSSSPPASPAEGNMWFDSDTAQSFTYYDSQWIELGASAMVAQVQSSAPTSPIAGQIWFDSDTGGTYIYYGTNWIEVGVAPLNAVLNTYDAKGDIVVATADNTIARLAVGSASQVLTVDSTTATGLKWATPTTYQAVVSNVSDTEIGYLDGVTSAIQTQLDTKASTGKSIAMAIVFGG